MWTWRSRARFLTVVVFCGACRSAPEPAPFATPAAVPGATVAVIDMVGYELLPRTLSVKVGQTVRFRNRNSADEVHSVRVTEVVNSAQLFGVGITPYSSSDHAFVRPGFYTVACDTHPMMRADILVTEP